MSDFRDAQEKAHPNKSNALLLFIIVVLILIVGLQIWLLYTALNNALAHNTGIAIPALLASLFLFLCGLGLMYYLPKK